VRLSDRFGDNTPNYLHGTKILVGDRCLFVIVAGLVLLKWSI
jgi:hypothetical protein